MENIQIDIVANGLTTLGTAGKYCDRNIDIRATVPGGIDAPPDYWKSYLANKVTEINSALTTAGDNKSAFLWYTDAHWADNFGRSPMILKYLSKNTGMQKTFFGGDIAQASSGEIAMLTTWQEMVKDIPNHRSVIGNHDNQVTELPTAADRADFFIMSNRTEDMASGTDATNGKMYYYVDSYAEKTRYICLSTGRMWTFDDEILWCIDALNSTPNGWHIVIISHLWLDNDYTDNGAVLNTTPPDYAQNYLNMFDAYNYRLSGSSGSVSYNFTNAGSKIEFIIGGHVHRDYDFATTNGIPVVLTECDSRYERDADSIATQGTTTENCVYGIVADYGAKVVKVINVGRGSSRNVAIPDVVKYTNWVKKSINSDKTEYVGLNGEDGYKSDYRLNSSGVEAAYTGYRITGFIPVRTGDIVCFENLDYMAMDFTSRDDGVAKFAFYNEDFSYLANNSHKPSSLPSAAWSPVYREDGNVKQVTIPTAYGSNVRYMRLCAKYIGPDSVITVNEEID